MPHKLAHKLTPLMQTMITQCLRTGSFTTINRLFAQYLKRMKEKYSRFLLRLSGRDIDNGIENTHLAPKYSSRERQKAKPKRRDGKKRSTEKVLDFA